MGQCDENSDAVEGMRRACTYKELAGDQDEDTALRKAGHGVKGCDLVLHFLEGQTLEETAHCLLAGVSLRPSPLAPGFLAENGGENWAYVVC